MNLSKNGMPWKVLGETRTQRKCYRIQHQEKNRLALASPAQWPMASGSSQLTPHNSPPIPRGPGLLQAFRLEPGTTENRCIIPFVPRSWPRREDTQNEPILSPIPTFLVEEWEVGWTLFWNKGRRMLVILYRMI